MEAKVEKNVKLILMLNAEETAELQCWLSHPIIPGEPEEEEEEEGIIRKGMLKAVNDALDFMATSEKCATDVVVPVEEITCPKCGVVFIPAWRYPGTKGITNCACGKRFEKGTSIEQQAVIDAAKKGAAAIAPLQHGEETK